MSTILRLAVRNAIRNRRRTALTAATVTIGVAFTVVTLSFLGGIFDAMAGDWARHFGPVRVVTAEFAEREALQPLHFNIPDSAPVVEQIEAVEGVAAVEPVIRTGVVLAVGEELGDDPAMLVGASSSWYERVVLPVASFHAGGWLEAGDDTEQVVLGARVAREVGAKVGDEILVMGMTQYGSMAPISADVVGVVTGNSVIDAQAYVTMETARWMVDVPAGALEVLVYPTSEDHADVSRMAATLAGVMGPAYTVTPWMVRGIWAQNLPVMESMNVIFSSIVVFVMALAIFNTMTMSVLERTGEIGVMRAMGQSRIGAVLTFLVEAMVIGLIGGVAGALVGTGPALYLEQNGLTYGQDLVDDFGTEIAMKATMSAELTPDILVIAVFVGILTAALGAFFPALRAARIQPHEAMRAQR